MKPRAFEIWNHIEHLLTEECGLLPDQGLEQQRFNCINAIRNGQHDPDLIAAAVDFLRLGSLHKVRIGERLMDRKEVADALSKGE